ncbi:MAG TPA: hypothetical protein PKD12_08135 [Nitrospira sp.]|nr:hypothetical protein [Nitrospira sp.]
MTIQFFVQLIAAFSFFAITYFGSGYIFDRVEHHLRIKKDREHRRFIQKVDRYYHEL